MKNQQTLPFGGMIGSFGDVLGCGVIPAVAPDFTWPAQPIHAIPYSVHDDGVDLVFMLEVPGIQLGDLSLTLEEIGLRVRGEKHSPLGDKKPGGSIRYGTLSQLLRVKNLREEAVSASLKDGVLTVRVVNGSAKPEAVMIPISQ